MSNDTTTTGLPVIELQEAGSKPANLAVLKGRQVSQLERTIEVALKNNASLDQLQQLLQMQERVMEIEARQAFVEAMSQFKLNPPEILKTKLVDFATKNNGRTTYMHEELGEICELIVKGLAEVGISHRWKPHREDGMFGVSCVLTHRQGHEQDDGAMWAPADTSGGKNTIQSMASTTKYLERYTLLMATGLAPKGMDDDDGRGFQEPAANWVQEIITTARSADSGEQLTAIRKAALKRCMAQKDRQAWDRIDEETKAFAVERGWLTSDQAE